ncbi:PucR family transcriptional regulator [Paenibacillus sp. 453mf]|uniref:PucR family transcriptional regulator n=1 Tax=Paenibacillus sp. 453mf TaxID=1761874 RepID=UPI0008EF485F|nr:PucR family transcriptional regulator [Paenibacillus sp. 453mf]SFS69272.1 transcriptional regulator, PucR family [Paenibacillus sp. 453mf]
MKISDLLDIPMLASSRVTAGREGLHRNVYSVNMMDSPDIFDYLKPNELLLTTGYVIKDKPEVLTQLVTRMAELGCAGLGIKTKRYLDHIPQEAKEAADRLQFPLLELSLDCALSEALHQLLARIMESRTEEMRYALESHRYFSDILLEGQSLQTILEELARLLSYPVILVNRSLEPFATSSGFGTAYSSFLQDISNWLPSMLNEARSPSIPLPSGSAVPFSYLLQYPIQTDQSQGYLLSFTNQNPVSTLSLLTLEQAANVISFDLLKRQAVKERSRRYKNDFFGDLVDGLISDKQDLIHRGRRYGLSEQRSYYCIVLKKDAPLCNRNSFSSSYSPMLPNDSIGGRTASMKEDLYELVKGEAKASGFSFILFSKNDAVVMLLPVNTLEEAALGEHQLPDRLLASRLQQMIHSLWSQHKVSLSIGVSNTADELSQLPRAYQEALDALQTGMHSQQQRYVQFYHVKELSDLLRMLPQEDLQEFIKETFAHLLFLEDKERGELLKTLRCFLDNHCHIADTAKQLYLHRNTVIYRLDKCEQLTGRSLRLPASSLRFRAAFLMEELLN